MTELNETTMWRAVRSNDAGYDGVFYFGVTSTGIFCRPSCKSRPPRPEHVRFFPEAQQALEAGFRPCKRCRPDRLRHEPLQETAAQVCAILERDYANPAILRELSRLVNLSPFHLQRSFKRQTGATPREYLRAVRIRAARRLLTEDCCDPPLNNTAIGYAVGFESLSGFYAAFRSETGLSPREYSRTRGRQGRPSHETGL